MDPGPGKALDRPRKRFIEAARLYGRQFEWNRILLGNGEACRRAHTSIDQQLIHLHQALRQLAQRTGRQQATVPQSPRTINYADLTVAPEAIMLHAVVGNNYVRAFVGKRQRCAHPVGIDCNRTTAVTRQQERFVANDSRITVFVNA